MTTTELTEQPPEEKPYCLCGCGIRTKGGTFVPGHDARYKSQLIAMAMGDDEIAAAEAARILEARGWTRFLDKKREVVAKAKAPRAKVEEDEFHQALRTSHVYLMKAAAKILRWTGQYHKRHRHHIELTNINAYHIAVRQHPLLILPEDGTEPDSWDEWEQDAVDNARKLASSYEAVLALSLEEVDAPT